MVLGDALPNSILRDMLQKLTRLSGDESTLAKALTIFADAPESVKVELEELVTVVREVKQRIPGINLFFDLCELRGYEYHTGIVFAAYTPAYGRAVAKGGRYDHIGEVFGRSRPASGFDSDLKVLAKLSSKVLNRAPGILAPDIVDEELSAVIDNLREQGEIVIVNLGNKILSEGFFGKLNCDREIIRKDDSWTVGPITK
jgi:ATP phosphoribosyltransferase regulatory subunit